MHNPLGKRPRGEEAAVLEVHWNAGKRRGRRFAERRVVVDADEREIARNEAASGLRRAGDGGRSGVVHGEDGGAGRQLRDPIPESRVRLVPSPAPIHETKAAPPRLSAERAEGRDAGVRPNPVRHRGIGKPHDCEAVRVPGRKLPERGGGDAAVVHGHASDPPPARNGQAVHEHRRDAPERRGREVRRPVGAFHDAADGPFFGQKLRQTPAMRKPVVDRLRRPATH